MHFNALLFPLRRPELRGRKGTGIWLKAESVQNDFARSSSPASYLGGR